MKTSRNRSFLSRSNSGPSPQHGRRVPERAAVTARVAQLVAGTYVSCSGGVGRLWYGRVLAHLLGYARVSTTEQNPDLQVDTRPGAGGGGARRQPTMPVDARLLRRVLAPV